MLDIMNKPVRSTMSETMNQTPKSPRSSRKLFIISIAIGVIVVAAIYAAATSRQNNSASPSEITQTVAENVCQDAANLKLSGKDIEVVSASNYRPQFSNNGQRATLSWNGKTKDGKDSPAFVCELSGTADNPKIEMLQMGSEYLI